MNLLELVERNDPRAAAIAAPGRRPLSYGGLRTLLGDVRDQLTSLGLSRGDAVALAVPNGPGALAVTIAVAEVAAVAPLNPSFTEAEFRFYLEDLSARAVIVSGECGARAAAAARGLDVPVLHMLSRPEEPAGAFCLEATAGQPRMLSGTLAHSESTALLLHTSGTTARPKLVGIQRQALAQSARCIARSLALGPTDVSLNVMPLFHVHGLIGAAFSTLAAGGAVCCTPGFNALRFSRWLEECTATWYTAVPSMHQAIVSRVRNDGGRDEATTSRGHALRFVRSCSSPLAPSVREALEACFGVPVLNAYGMTEAAHQVACTPLQEGGRPAPRGSVGLPTGPEVRVLGADGAWVPAGSRGEVSLRGETVITAYERPEEANVSSFHHGWLRTGDEGLVDAEGYLTLTGRLKELINSAGEKISPYEIEDLLLRHVAVAEAVCFGIPHRSRGETVGAAVVLRSGAETDERELRRFLAERLAPSKVPERVFTLPHIPKGPTGKLQRIGLAAVLLTPRA